ncbi:hypothetical protein LIER_35444 [Lithospermum erythrorhizon]|uniref:Uncharacterized protein n=1 Tax=Lithospermum erythrorhizon TaxID=34254 RepID=A0AAV3NQR9_LITER
MLLTVEGGGFVSSSVSGYSKGLTLLLLGQKSEDKPMRVTPWNQYQLVDQEANTNIQLDSHKNCLLRGCASFVCFRHATAGLESSSPLKVGPTQLQEVLPQVNSIHEIKDLTSPPDVVEENSIKKITIKSSLRKPKNGIEVSCGGNEEYGVLGDEGNKVSSEMERRKVQLPVPSGCDKEHEKPTEKNNEVSAQMKRRKVQWTDKAGGELVEIREFEPSDDGGSDDEFENGSEKSCSCTIM